MPNKAYYKTYRPILVLNYNDNYFMHNKFCYGWNNACKWNETYKNLENLALLL